MRRRQSKRRRSRSASSRGSSWSSSSSVRSERSRRRKDVVESATLMVRGLNPLTTEYGLEAAVAQFWPKAVRVVADRSTLERRGAFGFIEFPGIEYARGLMHAFPGPPHGPSLVVDGAEVRLEYGRGRPLERPRGVSSGHADWVCECGAINFARRVRCFTCSLDRPARPRMASDAPDQDQLGKYDTDEQTPCLVVYGLSRYTGEAELANAMRAYAPVKDVKLLRDVSGQTRGVGFVTFFNVQAAAHTLQTASGRASVDGQPVKLAYTKGAALAQVIARAALERIPPRPRPNPAAAAAAAASRPVEFDRRRSPSSGEESEGRRRRRRNKEWPPPFEANTAAYAFDPTSRYFYEPVSGFYYDPKTKVYYNAHTKDYYHYAQHASPPFTKFEAPQQPPPDNNNNNNNTRSNSKPAAKKRSKKHESSARKGPVAFGLAPAAPQNEPPKKVAPAFAASRLLLMGHDYDQLHRLVVDNKPVIRHCPTTGKWMCLVSRRQFNSESLLKKHVAKSALYRDALEKAAHESRLIVIDQKP
ncbi:hypothetical protein CTAYLR_009512 [Chrysophaeum taylorii]|uniref:Uncharacterized protein n=1 Tax=Chrysophaeum taylorii TaxID=2483200 RepID=A0AAD7UM41_9STRA|nr:hypothetical protein CTAYLR_009512 [Chrysophaeum taylorii]